MRLLPKTDQTELPTAYDRYSIKLKRRLEGTSNISFTSILEKLIKEYGTERYIA